MSKFSKRITGTCGVVLLVLSGCRGDINSEDLRTSGVGAEIDVVADQGNDTQVRAKLFAGSRGFGRSAVELTGGDSLTATAIGTTKPLTPARSLGFDVYAAQFLVNDPGTEFVISFSRPEDTDAPNSNVTLPDKPIISQPLDAQHFAPGDIVTVTWQTSVADNRIDILTDTGCSGGFNDVNTYADVGDSGIFELDLAGIYSQFLPGSALGSCNLEITVERRVSGNLDPSFGEGGFIRARQQQKVNVTVGN